MPKNLAIIMNTVTPVQPGENAQIAIYRHQDNVVVDLDSLSLVMSADLAVDVAKALQREVAEIAASLN